MLDGPDDRSAVVRQELVARQLDEQMSGRFAVGRRLRVLDVGMGRGVQALRLARAGHRVTGVERDAETIAAARDALAREPEGIRERMRVLEGDGRDTGVHFLPGSFDVVLCHGMLMYVEEPDPLLAGLARMLAPGGLLSLLVGNGDALAMRPGLRGEWSAALAAFDGGETVPAALPPSRTPAEGETAPARPRGGVRADRLATLTAKLAGIGAPLRAWYGVRVFTDAAGAPAGTGVAPDGDLAALLAAEERAGRTDPYRAVAALLHLCGVRG